MRDQGERDGRQGSALKLAASNERGKNGIGAPNAMGTSNYNMSAPTISLPKGGGAIQGIGEKFSANPVTGTGSLTIPIFTSPSRSDFYPKLALSYDSGAGNGPFGLGWDLGIPAITRKTDKGLPRYFDGKEIDVFILSGAEDLVPSLVEKNGKWEPQVTEKGGFIVKRYRPRIEGLFARIERWQDKQTAEIHWRSISRDNITSIYGRYTDSRVTDPTDERLIFKWLLEESHDDKGNIIVYEYKRENVQDISKSLPEEKHRLAQKSFPNLYIKHIRYGNQDPFQKNHWHFEVVFDYGEHADEGPSPTEFKIWPVRPDAHSSYRARFEVRTYRLCQRVLMFHRFSELGATPYLVRSTDFKHEKNPVATYLTEVTQTGYVKQGNTYLKKSFPSVQFSYAPVDIDETIRFVDTKSLENLPVGLGNGYQWVDFDSEGLPGIFTEESGGWFYKRNMGEGRFGPLEVLATKPSLAVLQNGRQQFVDLAGDGLLDLVQFSKPVPGYYERTDDAQWETFKAFVQCPNIDWSDPDLGFIDLTGDGHPDALIAQNEVFTWYPSLAEEGFGPSERVSRSHDEEKGPALVFADATQSIYLADMSGDGLTDIVRISKSEVCYWPNLGYGQFGPQVLMDHPPNFNDAGQFDQKRIRLADIDGSGTTDILYLRDDGVSIWFNQSGNRWSEERKAVPDRSDLSRIDLAFPKTDNLTDVTVTDFLGKGTACLVWSSPLPNDAGRQMRYVALLKGGIKPHLLMSVRNNLGAQTRIEYTASTKFYLQDREEGKPWITKLPFPVHVVEKVTVFDYVSQTKLVTKYKYHHGYFDGMDREFRGFGMVEQEDTESFNDSKSGVSGTPANAHEAFQLPPILTKTWFHTGAYVKADIISQGYKDEYYQGDPQAILLEDTLRPTGLTAEEEREACRALKGSVLRQEVYSLDGTDRSKHPYSVSERNYDLHQCQPLDGKRHAVFYTRPREAIEYHYERNPEDPRVSHQMTLKVDNFGNVEQAAAIVYPRRTPAFPEQAQTFITYSAAAFVNKPDETSWYRVGVPVETRTYEITGLPYIGMLSIEALRNTLDIATEIPYEARPTGTQQKRLIEHVRSLYLKNDLSGPLPLGKVESLLLPYETYKLAFTPGLLAQIYGTRITETVLVSEGEYLKSANYQTLGLFPPDLDDLWWVRSGQQSFDAARFYLPVKVTDPFGNSTTISYDSYRLLVTKTEDALHNTIAVENDYRVLAPRQVTDPNGNRSQAAFDALGMVVGTAVMGKETENLGDSLHHFEANLTEAVILNHFVNPLADPQAILRRATTRLVYDLFAYHRTKDQPDPQPAVVYTLAREAHAVPAAGLKIQISFSYSDGFGREIQKKIQAERGRVPKRDENGKIIVDAGGRPEMTLNDVSPRWVGSGWTVFNNKGKPVRQYEPFFTDTHQFEFDVRIGVSPILFYDPVERVVATLHPNHTYEKVVFDPWHQTAWDVNDTVMKADPRTDADVGSFFRLLDTKEFLPTWREQRKSGQLGGVEKDAADKAAKHGGTSGVAHLDTLGRTFLSIADNGPSGKYDTRVELDIEGNQRSVTDALGRKVMESDFDMLGTVISSKSMEAGERWMLNDVTGKPIRAWDSRKHEFSHKYDFLRRPTEMRVSGGDGFAPLNNLYEKIIYGEGQSLNGKTDQELNLRGKLFRHYDTAGRVQFEEYDFKGNLLRSTRRLLVDYKTQPNWAATPAVQQEEYGSSTAYDALNRPVMLTTPDNSVIRPIYNEANLLDGVNVNVRGAAVATPFVTNIDYNAKGQRKQIEYRITDSGGAPKAVQTSYSYDDPLTYRLTNLKTTRTTDHKVLQNLHYSYDPVGNITAIRDAAKQDVYFSNRFVDAHNEYLYDAVYRLIQAEGREQAANSNPDPSSNHPEWKPQYDFNDSTRRNLAHPNDGQAMQRYTEQYLYDEAGNIQRVHHQVHDAANTAWARYYAYLEASLIQPGKVNNRLTSSSMPGDPDNGPYSAAYKHDKHGNMIRMPHLPLMQWDFKDQLQATSQQLRTDGGTPEITYYVYDSSGQRVRKVTERQASPGQTPTRMKERIYLGGFEIYREYDSNGSTKNLERETLHIMDDKQRIALVETKTIDTAMPAFTPKPLTRYQFGNHLGSASLELDGAGEIISYEEYYPYGSTSYQAVRSQTETPKRYRYTGKERDEENGLSYHGARYYAPWMGRWVTCDPVGIVDGLNVYAYTRGNPISLIDSDGKASAPPQRKLNDVVPYDERLKNPASIGTNPEKDHVIAKGKQKLMNPSIDTSRQLTVIQETGAARGGAPAKPHTLATYHDAQADVKEIKRLRQLQPGYWRSFGEEILSPSLESRYRSGYAPNSTNIAALDEVGSMFEVDQPDRAKNASRVRLVWQRVPDTVAQKEVESLQRAAKAAKNLGHFGRIIQKVKDYLGLGSVARAAATKTKVVAIPAAVEITPAGVNLGGMAEKEMVDSIGVDSSEEVGFFGRLINKSLWRKSADALAGEAGTSQGNQQSQQEKTDEILKAIQTRREGERTGQQNHY